MISAKIIKDSISEEGKRITTVQVSLPKVLLAENNTHRVFSRNYSSSRAIPVKRFNAMESFEPLYWGKNQEGMTAKLEEIDDIEAAKKIWNDAIEYCKNASEKLIGLGLHKQWSNRLNDWHNMANGIITSTEWDNYFWLRDADDAQPEMQFLARCIKSAMENSTPTLLHEGEWHLPYITDAELNDSFFKIPANKWMLHKISSARCCRVSYNKHDGSIPNVDDDLALFMKLVGGSKIHASPLEHQATPDQIVSGSEIHPWKNDHLHGNLQGWIQYRKIWEAAIS